MFTGIIETMGTLIRAVPQGSNMDYWIESDIAAELKIDQSVAHNGVCLTVVEKDGPCYRVTAVAETLAKTNLAGWKEGMRINLERSLKIGDRLDGHFVQGHVDTTALCARKDTFDGSWVFHFQFPKQFAELVIEKGSVCLNGTSLTVFGVGRDTFAVTIIPYTYAHTNFHLLEIGDAVNVEFDVLGKYWLRRAELSAG